MEGEDSDSDSPHSFGAAAWWKRLIILVAGAAMNFAVGFLIFWGLFGLTPGYANIPQPVIAGFYEGNTIEGEAGLQVGDEIVSIDGERVYVSSNISFLLSMNLSDDPATHDVVVLRDGKKVELKDFVMERQLVQSENGQQMLYGMQLTTTPRTFLSGLRYSWLNTMDTVRSVRLSLQMLLSGRAGLQDVGGPVMIVQQITETAENSGSTAAALLNVLYFGAFIAVNLAVMNLLPIPALDGGRAVCLLLTTGYEAITKRKINPKYEGYLHGAGMMILLAFMALVTFKDIFNIFRG
jgi:regulator of sigma E protease